MATNTRFTNELRVQTGGSGGQITAPWAEFISKEGATQEYSFGVNESQCIFRIITPVDGTRLQETVRQILGYSYKDPASGVMHRVLPIRHPRFYWMWAQRITNIQMLSWNGKVVGNSGVANYSDYTHAIITIQFWSPPYEILGDGVSEYQRYVIRNFQPTTEVLTLDNGGFQFVVNADGPAPVSTGATAKVPTGFIITKVRIILKWLQVPDDFLFNAGGSNNGGLPTGVLGTLGAVPPVPGVGCINNAAFMGYPAKTLLLEAPQFEPVVQPCEPAVCLNTPAANLNSVPRAWNVTIPMLYFNPPVKGGAASSNPVGHSSAPSTDGYWWAIQSTVGAHPLYASYDFTKIFKTAP